MASWPSEDREAWAKLPTGPRAVPDVAGRDVGGSRARPVSMQTGAASPGAAHALRSEPGYHEVARPLGDVLRGLWARWASFRDRHGA